MKKICYIISLLLLVFGCHNKANDSDLYHVVKGPFIVPGSSPLILSFHNNKDTIICCIDAASLYQDKWNLITMNEEEFKDMIYEYIISEKPLLVNEELFRYLKEWCVIKVIPEIKAIYDKGGIKAVLDIYLDEYNALFYLSNVETAEHDYIIYLSFINGYYFFWDHEAAGLFLLQKK